MFHSGQALTSRNSGLGRVGSAASSFSKHASMGKSTYEYDFSKEPHRKAPKESTKKFFDPKFSKNLYFWPFLVKKSINLVSLQSSIDVGMHVIAQNDHNTILFKWAKKIPKLLSPKIQIIYWGPKMAINNQKSKIFLRSESI